MLADLYLNVCTQCGDRELRPAKKRGLFENLFSWFFVPYRCEVCSRRQIKLSNVRISPVKHIVVKQKAVSASAVANRHAGSVTFAVQPSYGQNAALAERTAPAELQEPRARAIAFLEPEVMVEPAAQPVVIAKPSPHPRTDRLIAGAFQKTGTGLLAIRKPVLWVVIAAAGLELILQVAAGAAWFANRPRPQHLVLCFGDSYTLGTGATGSELSYPSALEKLLRKTDKSWQVVNAGSADRDSHDAVLALPDPLLHFRPSLVYIVVGASDSVKRPRAVAPAVTKSVSYDFPLLWRTPMLFDQFAGTGRVLAAKASDTVSDWSRYLKFRSSRPSGPSLIGTWLYAGQVVRIQDDGLVAGYR